MNKSETIDKARSAGLIAKGIIYILLGYVTAMSAFGQGGQKAGSKDVLYMIKEQPLGQVLLIITAVGLALYVLWRIFSAIYDPADKGNDFKGIIKRIGYFFSGLMYGGLSYVAFKIALSGSGGGGGTKQQAAQQASQSSFDEVIFIAGLVITAGLAIYQIYKGISGSYLKKLDEPVSDWKKRKIARISGAVGFTARGVVFGVFAFFFYQAMQSGEINSFGTKEAFQFVQQLSYGDILLGIIAIGLLFFGIFNLFIAKYSKYTTMA